MKYKVEEILKAVNGSSNGLESSLEIWGYSIDSRTVKPGDLFFAFQGDVQDGHKFVPLALEAGATAAMVRDDYSNDKVDSGKLIYCNKGLKGLHDLASFSREEQGLKLVGITGSCGKTTTKDITAALLSSGLKTEKSWGNYNNIWGMPLSLLRRQTGMDVYVCEMGMSFAGELSQVTQIARPDVMILTNVRPVHMVNFGSLQEIAEAKAEAFQGLKADGTIVANFDDPEVMRVAVKENKKIFTFGFDREANLSISGYQSLGVNGISFTLKHLDKTYEFSSPLPGKHNLYNLLAGLSAGLVLGLEIAEMMKRLAKVELSPLRGHLVDFKAGWTLFDDSYNSNPAALSSVLRMISESKRFSGKIAVIGDMLELGSMEEKAHREIGELVVELGFKKLVTVGKLSAYAADAAASRGLASDNIFRCENAVAAAEVIESIVSEGEVVLIKGSRGIKLDQAVAKLVEANESLETIDGVRQKL